MINRLVNWCKYSISFVGLFSVFTLGCSPGGPKQQEIKIIVVDPINEVKSLLVNYSKGSPVTSEASGFPDLVARVRAVSPEKADILAAGFEKILANPEAAKKTADALLKQL